VIAPSCSDGTRNGDETGIDCGGSCVDDCGCDVAAVVRDSDGGSKRATSAVFANGDVVGQLSVITPSRFNALMASGAAALRHNYAIVVAAGVDGLSLDWDSNVMPYLVVGGSLVIEVNGGELTQLSPGVVAANTNVYFDSINIVPSST
jgi:hypothetical protein